MSLKVLTSYGTEWLMNTSRKPTRAFSAIFPSVALDLALATHKADREIVFVHF